MAVLIFIAPASTGSGSAPVAVAAESAANDTPYKLTSALRAGVKTVLNERVPDGFRIGAVVRLYNTGSRSVAVPGYEVRAVTTGGDVYTLMPSADNPRIVQPKEKAELSYMLRVARSDAFSLKRLEWVEVDEYVYPKKETVILNMPVAGLEWSGPSTVFTDAKRLKAWGDSFTIPTESAGLVYTPVRFSERHTPQGTTAVLVLEAKNTGSRPAWVPEFTVTGRTEQDYYPAERAESGPIEIQPGDVRYLHFVMRLPGPERWTGFTIGTPESFSDASGTVRYEAGRLQIKPPAASEAQQIQTVYSLFNPIRVTSTFRPNLAKEVDISLAEVYRFEQAGDGYLTAVAKFRLLNRSRVTVAVPNFGVEWTTSTGVSYAGERLEPRQKMLSPGVGMMVAYVFTLPLSAERDTRARLTLLDGHPDTFQLPVGAVEIRLDELGKVANRDEDADNLYPFRLAVGSGSVDDESGILGLEIDLTRTPNVVFDEESVRLKIEIADGNDRVLASKIYALAGPERLTSGLKTFDLGFGNRTKAGADTSGSDESAFKGPFIVRVYEVLAAPGGNIERLVESVRLPAE
ncbi:MAG: hypothetical protein A9Z00_11095 [Thermobacillus sp. ZCTH02-B1]|nr:MAG: hypothetical protein A9Z00_11095 [Thermobacillus sp. ZCTH02-B1]